MLDGWHHHHFDDHLHSLYHDPDDEFFGTVHDHGGVHHHHGDDGSILYHGHDNADYNHDHFADHWTQYHRPDVKYDTYYSATYGDSDHTHEEVE